MTIESFREMYDAELAEAASFEAMLARSVEELGAKTSSGRLREALAAHAAGPEQQIHTLSAMLREHGRDPQEHVDQAMQAMVGEANKMADMVAPGPLRDAAIIASLQRLKHYEVAVYGTLATYAKCLGLEDEKRTLGEILQREKDFDRTLSEIAKEVVNPQAVSGQA